VDRQKRQHLVRAAMEYARRAGVDPAHIRFDVISVVLCSPPSVQLEKDVFSRRSVSRFSSR
jgi:Holliday junction resolvase-like predicted endonuclease